MLCVSCTSNSLAMLCHYNYNNDNNNSNYNNNNKNNNNNNYNKIYFVSKDTKSIKLKKLVSSKKNMHVKSTE